MRFNVPVQQIFVVGFISLLLMSVSVANASVAEFTKVHGVVDVFHAGERKAIPVSAGAVVNVGDIVRTGRRSRAQLKFADGSVLNIGSLAKIEIGEFVFDAESKVRKSSIRNLRGKVRAAVGKVSSNDSYFRIKTPVAVAAVRGTNYAVDVKSPTETMIVTFEGAVAVANIQEPQKNVVMVLANQMTRVVGTQAPTAAVTASAQVLGSMVEGTGQVESSDSEGADASSSSSDSGSGSGDSSDSGSGSDDSSDPGSGSGDSSASGSGSGDSSASGSGSGRSGGKDSSSGVVTSPQATAPSSASTVPVAASVSPMANSPATPLVMMPQANAPTGQQAAIVTPPAPITPPVTVTVPAINKVNVDVIITFQ